MQLTCDACGTQYQIDAGRLGGTSTAVRCVRCGHLFVVIPEETVPESVPESASEPTVSSTPAKQEEETVQDAAAPRAISTSPEIRREYLPVPIPKPRVIKKRLGFGRALFYAVVWLVLLVFGYQYIVGGVPAIVSLLTKIRGTVAKSQPVYIKGITAQRLHRQDGSEWLVIRGDAVVTGGIPSESSAVAKVTFYDTGNTAVRVVTGGTYTLLDEQQLSVMQKDGLLDLPGGILQRGVSGPFMIVIPDPPTIAAEFSVVAELKSR